LHGGRGGPGDFGAPDEEERDGDGAQADEPADPECPVESAGERVRDGVALAERGLRDGPADFERSWTLVR
jgi:hypothetical protein